jgi:signal transduction histidine kinase
VDVSEATSEEEIELLQQRLARCERRFLQFFHEVADPLIVVVKHHREIAVANEAFTELTGLRTSQDVSSPNARTHDWRRYVDRRDHAAFDRMLVDAIAGDTPPSAMIRLVHPDTGTVTPCSLRFHRVTKGTNTFSIVFRDMRDKLETEQRLARYARDLEERNEELRDTQAQLVQQGKMAALGSLVAGVAHEINTPLGSIRANAELADKLVDRLRGKAGVDPEKLERNFAALAEATNTVTVASDRIGDIVGSLRSFARLDESEIKRVDLHEGLDSALQLAGHMLESRVTLERDYGELPPIECRPGELNQAFMNLLTNAVQAITVQGDSVEGTVRVRTRLRGDEVHMAIEDDGSGIAPEQQGRLFDPGYTTKGVGVGTGLGLSIAYRIVASHGGRIDVRSEPGQGSTFTVVLPVGAADGRR